mmetsp:Transcript_42461/g.68227  ORF Transcript_42461/g.68227 Transcript_42461/m.68227 type:complete len:579 (+) Transcript_42461:27-1763(+)
MASEFRSQSVRNVLGSKPLPMPPSKSIPPQNRPLPPTKSRPKVGFVSQTPKLEASKSKPVPRSMNKPPPSYSLPPAITKSTSLHRDAKLGNVSSPPAASSAPSLQRFRQSKSSSNLFGKKPTMPQTQLKHHDSDCGHSIESNQKTVTHKARFGLNSPKFSQSKPTSPIARSYRLPASPPSQNGKGFVFPIDADNDKPRNVHFKQGNGASPVPRHRVSKTYHFKQSNAQQQTKPPPQRPMTPHRHQYRQQHQHSHQHQHVHKTKHAKKKVYDDAHYDEAELDSEDDEKDHQIDWKRGEMIGIGAFGKVYKAYDKNTGQLFAIKQIPFDPNTLRDDEQSSLLSASQSKKTRLKQVNREAHVMRQLQHANIVQFYGYQQSRKYRTLCILMEFVDGSSIDTLYLKSGRFPEQRIKTYTKQILSALDFAHSKKVIHRDIKGKNILVSKSGVIKLADFGSAKLTDAGMGRQSLKFTASMNYNYTPLWTAPEVLHGKYDAKIDIWSVGCVMIEMATAKQPWAECNFENPFAALYHIGQPDKLPKYDHSFLSGLCHDFIRMCLMRDPAKRCSASELLRHEFLDSSV